MKHERFLKRFQARNNRLYLLLRRIVIHFRLSFNLFTTNEIETFPLSSRWNSLFSLPCQNLSFSLLFSPPFQEKSSRIFESIIVNVSQWMDDDGGGDDGIVTRFVFPSVIIRGRPQCRPRIIGPRVKATY